MLLEVVCENCGGPSLARCDHADARVLEALLVAAHASGHTTHRLVVRIDGREAPEGEHQLALECLDGGCGSGRKQVSVRCPMSLVSAHTISFHTHHEGHPLRITLDGKQIHPQQ